ncbi:hypothetical protein COLO4_15248 [Corchorus olitorius]|uniref:HAT C-terminal dimerisation domain-containing protein n=1 Tax=Corchorus olitorius TaxID=93759 RepID=A0A1R3JNZ0_9ROSI|nr:hypothetical protein COLO4_15248 [Corchorus olitorius]
MDEEVDDDSYDAMQKFLKHQMESGLEANKYELDIYLQEQMKQGAATFDVLLWWKLNSARFPILSCLVRDVIVVPVSTIASESAFSTSGRVLDVYRICLNPKMVQALICCQGWRKGSCEFGAEAKTH